MQRRRFLLAPALAPILSRTLGAQTAPPGHISGIYPHLAMYNSQGECGTGAVVPWAGHLWVVTYSPHEPGGSDDKLYQIDSTLHRVTRPESIGGTPANRMIHRESNQLFLGPYAIDAQGNVRAIGYQKLFGRPTGNARHLTRPADLIYYATMEEGFYEVDVHTLAVRELYEDANRPYRRKETKDVAGPLLPGYHGKGFYSGQGRVVYANNGEIGGGLLPPSAPSGCLAEWDGKDWKVVRRNQFCEVTGPGGLEGNANPATDPIWSIGWDHRSLILMLLDHGQWHSYRLPKASHAYDGAHGWNTEWPRIRDIGEKDLLMTMHGMFWRFPKTFSLANSAGIAPRSTYLKVIADFARWQDRIVFACDDTAKSEFYNTHRAKGKLAAPGQSHSNLWFVEPARLDHLGVPLGRGAVWMEEDVPAQSFSDPFLFSGFENRALHLAHQSGAEITFTLETDRLGNGAWSKLRDVKVPPNGYSFVVFTRAERGAWIRLAPTQDCHRATACFQFSHTDRRAPSPALIFQGLARAGAPKVKSGLLWTRGENKGTLLYAQAGALYELDAQLNLKPVEDPDTLQWMQQNLAPPAGVLSTDAASVLFIDDAGRRWRLPKGDVAFDSPATTVRVSREVSTERDLFNAHGTFYELPANNAGGFAMLRPIATHNLAIGDYCSWRGLLVLNAVSNTPTVTTRIVRSPDARAALWLGVFDDLWQLGKPRGDGGPWLNTAVQAGTPSDPYLMTGYDLKTLRLSHDQPTALPMRVEVDLTGTGLWVSYSTFEVPPSQTLEHAFPPAFSAYWLRLVALGAATATAQLSYR